jgi:hypothetical protein
MSRVEPDTPHLFLACLLRPGGWLDGDVVSSAPGENL